MQKILAYPLTAIYGLVFLGILIVFHPIQWVCYNVLGYHTHRISVAFLNLSLLRCAHILGTRYTFHNPHDFVVDRPAIIVSNHQNMNDIPPIIWWMRKYDPKFVSKKELGKGIPSVSYNLRHGGSVLIDRANVKQSLAQISELGKYIEAYKRAAVIFPEGTRSRTGEPKPFKTTGLKLLMRNAPSAVIIPVSISNSWKMLKYGKFPYGLGNHIKIHVHAPIEIDGNIDKLIAKVETIVNSGIERDK